MSNAVKYDTSYKALRPDPISSWNGRRSRVLTPIDVNAPPIDSSDEASTKEEKSASSGDSEFGEKSSRDYRLRSTGRNYRSASRISPQTSGTREHGSDSLATSYSDSPGSNKRGSVLEEDDVDPFGRLTQRPPKKTRTSVKPATYTSSQGSTQTISRSTKKARLNSMGAKSDSKSTKQGTKSFKAAPGLREKLEQATRWQARSRAASPKLDEPASMKGSPESQQALQCSSKTVSGLSGATTKSRFVKPSHTDLPRNQGQLATFKKYPNTRPASDASQSMRSSAHSRIALSSVVSNASKPDNRISATAHEAVDELGLVDIENVVDPSVFAGSSQSQPDGDFRGPNPSVKLDDFAAKIEMLPSSTVTASSQPPQSSDNVTVSSGLSSPPDSPSSARCPLCKGVVNKAFLYEVTGGKRLRIREQAAFCKAHQMKNANIQWKERGYPDVDWRGLDQRIGNYHPVLDDILQGRRLSYYRTAFEDSLNKGMNRTLRQTMMQGGSSEALSPGYYGSRGARVMVDNIMSCFTRKLRRLAASDKLISSGGVSGYVQAVLVPELAVLLVMDDMETDEDGARYILKDSMEIGNLLNEEQDEFIKEAEHDGIPDIVEIS